MQNAPRISQGIQISKQGNIQYNHNLPLVDPEIEVLVYNNKDFLEVIDGARSQTGNIQVIGCGDVIVGSGCTGQD
jgi:hypothetical protein